MASLSISAARAQQQTSRMPLLLSIEGTDRRTDGHPVVTQTHAPRAIQAVSIKSKSALPQPCVTILPTDRSNVLSVLWHGWAPGRITRPVKIEWCCVGMVNFLLSVWDKVQIVCMVQLMPVLPKTPSHLLRHLNPDWFYLSGTGLPMQAVLEKRCSVVTALR